MRCSICEGLHREHTRECATEAQAIIQQQTSGSSLTEQVEEVVTSSRKRQVKIASKLNDHKAQAHAA